MPTTTVGSFPKPPYLQKARNAFHRGQLGAEALHALEEKATVEWIREQERIGLDVLVDGEQYRGDMATYFAENLDGARISGLVRSYGNRYYRKPVVVDELQRPHPITVDWWRFAQKQTAKPVKGMITGPYTMMDWSFNEFYPSRRDMALAFARVLHEEVRDLEAAGATIIQVDEPAVSTKPEELPIAIAANAVVMKDLSAKTINHICYGNFDVIYPDMLKMPAQQLDLEMANSGLELLDLFRKHPFTKEIAFGVLDVHDHRVEDVETVYQRIKQALTVLKPEQVWVDPDCGLKTRTHEETVAKLESMVAAVHRVRAELGAAGTAA